MLLHDIYPAEKKNTYRLGNWSHNRIGSNVNGDQIFTLFEDRLNQEFYIPPALFRKMRTGEDQIRLFRSQSELYHERAIAHYVKRVRSIWEQILAVQQNAHLRAAYYQ